MGYRTRGFTETSSIMIQFIHHSIRNVFTINVKMNYFSFLPFCFTMSQPRCSYSWHHLKCHSYRCTWLFEPSRDKTNKMACAPSEDSDQPGHPPSLWVLSYPTERTAKTLIRLGGCRDWSESSLGTHAILSVFAGRTVISLVLSWDGSFTT